MICKNTLKVEKINFLMRKKLKIRSRDHTLSVLQLSMRPKLHFYSLNRNRAVSSDYSHKVDPIFYWIHRYHWQTNNWHCWIKLRMSIKIVWLRLKIFLRSILHCSLLISSKFSEKLLAYKYGKDFFEKINYHRLSFICATTCITTPMVSNYRQCIFVSYDKIESGIFHSAFIKQSSFPKPSTALSFK